MQQTELEENVTALFEFRVVEFKMPHPITGNRFWIERKFKIETKEYYKPWWLLNLGYVKKEATKLTWLPFTDPASTEQNVGYKTLVEANHIIHRYKFAMNPTYHNYIDKQ